MFMGLFSLVLTEMHWFYCSASAGWARDKDMASEKNTSVSAFLLYTAYQIEM
jgi:hypothetical protein